MARFALGTHVKEHTMHKASVGRVSGYSKNGFVSVVYYDGTEIWTDERSFVAATPANIKLGLAIAAKAKEKQPA